MSKSNSQHHKKHQSQQKQSHNIVSKTNANSKEVVNQQIKINSDPSRSPLKHYPDLPFEGFRHVLPQLEEDRSKNNKEKRLRRRQQQMREVLVSPKCDTEEKSIPNNFKTQEQTHTNNSNIVTQPTSAGLSKTVQFKEDTTQILRSPLLFISSQELSNKKEEETEVYKENLIKPLILVKQFEPDIQQLKPLGEQPAVKFITSENTNTLRNDKQKTTKQHMSTAADTPSESNNINLPISQGQNPVAYQKKKKNHQTKSYTMQSMEHKIIGSNIIKDSPIEQLIATQPSTNNQRYIEHQPLAPLKATQLEFKGPLKTTTDLNSTALTQLLPHATRPLVLLSPKQSEVRFGSFQLKELVKQESLTHIKHNDNKKNNLKPINRITNHGLIFQNHAATNVSSSVVSQQNTNRDKSNKIAINIQDLITNKKVQQTKPVVKMPQVGRQSLDLQRASNIVDSAFPSKKRRDKNKLQLQQHVVVQLMPQQSPQGQGGSQDTHYYKSQDQVEVITKNKQLQQSTALPNIKKKSTFQVRTSQNPLLPLTLKDQQVQKLTKRSNLRIIDEEPPVVTRGSQANDETFYPENLRSAKNRISRLLKQKKAETKHHLIASSIDSDYFPTTAKVGNTTQYVRASSKRRSRDRSQNSSPQLNIRSATNKIVYRHKGQRDSSLDNKNKERSSPTNFQFYQMDSSYLEISEEKKFDLFGANNFAPQPGPNLSIIGPDNGSISRRTGINHQFRKKKQHRLSKLEQAVPSDQLISGRSSFIKKTALVNKNAGDSLRETLTKIYFNNNQSNIFEQKLVTTSTNGFNSQSPPKKSLGATAMPLLKVSKNYKYQNQQQLAESVLIYATPLRRRKRNKLAYLLRAQRLYHTKDGNWLAQLAGIKKKSRLIQYNSRDVLRELVSSISSALSKKKLYRRYRTQYFDKNQTSTIGHDTILSSSLQKDSTIIKEEGYQSKQSFSTSPRRQIKPPHHAVFNMTQRGGDHFDLMMRDMKKSTKSIERMLTNEQLQRSKHTITRSLSPSNNNLLNYGSSHERINDSLYQYYTGSRQQFNNQMIDLSEDDTVIIA